MSRRPPTTGPQLGRSGAGIRSVLSLALGVWPKLDGTPQNDPSEPLTDDFAQSGESLERWLSTGFDNRSITARPAHR
jgi:hypothetical protein